MLARMPTFLRSLQAGEAAGQLRFGASFVVWKCIESQSLPLLRARPLAPA
jgi:hypothetical protein